jgi:dCMP deaminase
LRAKFPGFVQVSVYASRSERRRRSLAAGADPDGSFEEKELRESDSFTEHLGVRLCYTQADVVVINDDALDPEPVWSAERVGQLLDGGLRPAPGPLEIGMAHAISAGRNSVCLRSSVGAAVVSAEGEVISTGCNRPPTGVRSCADAGCARSLVVNDFSRLLTAHVPDAGRRENVLHLVSRLFRSLDRCRGLHAEEAALMGALLDGRGPSLRDATLYSTRYPCLLCAKQAIEAGVARICHLEPYPDDQVQALFSESGMEVVPFSGVTPQGRQRFQATSLPLD